REDGGGVLRLFQVDGGAFADLAHRLAGDAVGVEKARAGMRGGTRCGANAGNGALRNRRGNRRSNRRRRRCDGGGLAVILLQKSQDVFLQQPSMWAGGGDFLWIELVLNQ